MNLSESQTSKITSFNQKDLFYIFLLLLISVITYLPAFKLGFTNYDDQRYILENQRLVFKLENISFYFTNFFDGHYHPFTMLSLMLDYSLFGINATAFHTTNLLLHLLNTSLVYIFIKKLIRNNNVAVLTALLFAVSPMGVESVAWLSERKNLLYSFFLLLSLLFYLQYNHKAKFKYYLFTLLAFIFSVSSKAQAVSLPLLLILIDYYQTGFSIKRNKWLEKIPFICISVGAIVLAHFAQASFWGEISSEYSLFHRLIYASQALTMYLLGLCLPFGLSAIYPYPMAPGGSIPWHSYFFLLTPLIYLALIVVFANKNRLITLALLFFGFNIVFLLKVTGVPFGDYYMADRYVYLASVGLFLLFSLLVFSLARAYRRYRMGVFIFSGAYILFLIITSQSQIKTWTSSISLWSNVIEHYPGNYQAWNDLGNAHASSGNFAAAEKCYRNAIGLEPEIASAYNNFGNLKARESRFEDAILLFNKAIELDPKYAEAYNNRGSALEETGQYRRAIEDFKMATKLKPGLFLAWVKLSENYLTISSFESAYDAVDKALKLNPDIAFAYELKGNILMAQNKYREALQTFVLANNSGLDNAGTDLKKGICYYKLKDFQKALQNLNTSLKSDPRNSETYKYLGYTYYNLGAFKQSIGMMDKALEQIKNDPVLYALRGMARMNSSNASDACDDLRRAYQMGLTEVKDEIEKYCK